MIAAISTLGSARGSSLCFAIGCGLMILFALGHWGGVFAGLAEAKKDGALGAQLRSQADFKLPPVLGMTTSLGALRLYFSLSFSVLLAALAAVGFVARGALVQYGNLQWVALVYAGLMLVLLALSVRFRVMQGVISCGTIAGVFVLATELWVMG